MSNTQDSSQSVWDTQFMRSATDVEGFPYSSRMVPFIRVKQNGRVDYATTIGDKRDMLRGLRSSDLLLAIWPGKLRSDAFVVDHDVVLEAMSQ